MECRRKRRQSFLIHVLLRSMEFCAENGTGVTGSLLLKKKKYFKVGQLSLILCVSKKRAFGIKRKKKN